MTVNLTSVRAAVAEEIAATEELVATATAELGKVIANGEPEQKINAAVFYRTTNIEKLTELRHTSAILNEDDHLSFLIPNLIAAGKDGKVSQHTLGVIIDLLGYSFRK